jgi:hypothetical protein
MRPPAPLRLRVGVELATAPSPPVHCALLGSLLKHVLFIHGQIPSPYDAIVKELAAAAAQPPGRCRKASRRRAMLRKARKLTDTLAGLLDALPRALNAIAAAQRDGLTGPGSAPLVAALAIGSSPSSPRMVFLLRFEHGGSEPYAHDSCPPTASELDGARRRLVRSLMTSCGDLAAARVGLSRMHLLLQAPRDVVLPPAFQPRPTFRLKLRRAHACCVEVGPPALPASTEACATTFEHRVELLRTGQAGDSAGAGASPPGAPGRMFQAPVEGFDEAGGQVDPAAAAEPGEYIWFLASHSAMHGFAA